MLQSDIDLLKSVLGQISQSCRCDDVPNVNAVEELKLRLQQNDEMWNAFLSAMQQGNEQLCRSFSPLIDDMVNILNTESRDSALLILQRLFQPIKMAFNVREHIEGETLKTSLTKGNYTSNELSNLKPPCAFQHSNTRPVNQEIGSLGQSNSFGSFVHVDAKGNILERHNLAILFFVVGQVFKLVPKLCSSFEDDGVSRR